jgi:hypothetical protein
MVGVTRSVVRGRVPLWVAFVLVHVTVMWLANTYPSQPMGDVYNVYEPWSAEVLRGEGMIGITEQWVYPQLAILPMLGAWVFGFLGYTPAWAWFVTACDAAVFALLVGRGRSRGRSVAAWFWLAAILLLGPVALYRLDAITVALAIAGCLWLVRRPWLASVLLAVATWMKVWPAALLGAAVIAVRRRGALIGGALAVSVVTLGAVVALGGAPYAFGFLSDQADRGLQLEAPVSGLYLWQAMLGLPGSAVYYSYDIITFEVTGPGVQTVSAVMTPLLVVAVGAVALLGAWRAWRGAPFATLFPPLALALVLAFVVFNKVGSPQYMSWLVPPIVLGLVLERRRWAGPAAVTLLVSWLTQLVYPVVYDDLIAAQPVAVALLTARNLLLVALLVWTVAALVRTPGRVRPAERPAAADAAAR